MKVILKNFFRRKHTELTIKSIRHFMPEAEIHVLHFFKHETNELHEFGKHQILYDEPLAQQYFAQTKYHGMGSAVANAANGLFFTEGFNFMADLFKGCDDKVLMLAEDHFFTTGDTLRELQATEFDIAYAPWNSDDGQYKGANGSILCVRPARVKFPMREMHIPIEGLLQAWIYEQKVKVHALSTRAAIDYKGDGFYTNSDVEIADALRKKGIL